MNKPYLYLPLSFLVLSSIAIITHEMPYYSLMLGVFHLIGLAVALAVMSSMWVYIRRRPSYSSEELYVATGSCFLFSAVFAFAALSLCNRWYASKHCSTSTFSVLHCEPRYSSAYGQLKKGKLEANHWVLTLSILEEECTFVTSKKIEIEPVTNTVQLEFCKGKLNTKYLKL